MCNCKNIKMGTYENTQIVVLPAHMKYYKGGIREITIDTCIVDEIKYLWSMGITTYGSCCGHNEVESMVNVDENDIPLMHSLGYKSNHIDTTRQDTFKLKST